MSGVCKTLEPPERLSKAAKKRLVEEEKKHLTPLRYDNKTGEISLPTELVEQVMLDDDQSSLASGTRLHSLRLMEALILSGRLSKQEMINLLKVLAEYQFIKASSPLKATTQKEKAVEDYIQELEDGLDA